MSVPVLRRNNFWYCPNCDQRSVTHEPRPHSRFHTCSGLRGLVAPMLPAGTAGKVELQEREVYIGSELVQLDDTGRPVQSVLTTRDTGQDVAVFAPTATAKGSM